MNPNEPCYFIPLFVERRTDRTTNLCSPRAFLDSFIVVIFISSAVLPSIFCYSVYLLSALMLSDNDYFAIESQHTDNLVLRRMCAFRYEKSHEKSIKHLLTEVWTSELFCIVSRPMLISTRPSIWMRQNILRLIPSLAQIIYLLTTYCSRNSSPIFDLLLLYTAIADEMAQTKLARIDGSHYSCQMLCKYLRNKNEIKIMWKWVSLH